MYSPRVVSCASMQKPPASSGTRTIGEPASSGQGSTMPPPAPAALDPPVPPLVAPPLLLLPPLPAPACPPLAIAPMPESPASPVKPPELAPEDRKSTRLNSSHGYISYAV